MYNPSFNEEKTAQLAAYLTAKSGGEIYHLMLMKLLYISDRNALATLGYTISDDHYISMNYGPVLLNTLSLIDGNVRERNGLWSKLLSPSQNYKISLLEQNSPDTLALSKAELDIADAVFDQFGQMNRFDLADKTHEFSEWTDPQGSAIPIRYESILKAVGYSDEEAENVIQALNDVKAAKAFLQHL